MLSRVYAGPPGRHRVGISLSALIPNPASSPFQKARDFWLKEGQPLDPEPSKDEHFSSSFIQSQLVNQSLSQGPRAKVSLQRSDSIRENGRMIELVWMHSILQSILPSPVQVKGTYHCSGHAQILEKHGYENISKLVKKPPHAI